MPADYTVFAHLFDPSSEVIAVQSDAMPRANHYPTSRWAAGEVVSETISLSLENVLPGSYRLGVGLYWIEEGIAHRLPAVDAQGESLPDGRLVLPSEIVVP